VTENTDRDVEKSYPLADFVAELRRFADALEAGEGLEIDIEGERISVPAGAVLSVEHEREDGEEELEFQIKWTLAAAEGDDDDEEEDDEEEDDEAEEAAEAEEGEEEDDDEEEDGETDDESEEDEKSGETRAEEKAA
jgi:amphi-Trp domain-containing protein